MEPNDVTSTTRPGFLTRTARRAEARMDALADHPASTWGWGLRATRDIAVFGLCLLTEDTLSYVQRKAGRR